jgi:SsrA-binding protein
MLIVKNRKALFNHQIVEKFLAGIELKGYEVKSIKEKNVTFEGAYVTVTDGQVFVQNLHIGKYSKQSQEYIEQESRRPRKLLLHKQEIKKLQKERDEKGKTAVPLALLLKGGKVKLEFAVVKGRKKHEKKQLLKKRQIEIDLQKDAKQQGIIL